MASEETEDNYCQFCKTSSFDKFDKHLRTNLHNTNWSKALAKIDEKITLAKSAFLNPVVVATCDMKKDSTSGESNDKFWCHVCNNEFSKHWLSEMCNFNGGFLAVINGGVVGHFAGNLHITRLVAVRKRYRSQMSCADFALPKSSYDLVDFASRVDSACAQFVRDRDERLRLAATKLDQLETSRKCLVVDSNLGMKNSVLNKNPPVSEICIDNADDMHPNEDDYVNRKNLHTIDSMQIRPINSQQRKRLKQCARKRL